MGAFSALGIRSSASANRDRRPDTKLGTGSGHLNYLGWTPEAGQEVWGRAMTTILDVERIGPNALILHMGPQHPATHGILRLDLETEGEVITKVTPYIGYLHRCFEKHAESLGWQMVIPYTDRMDYVAAIHMELGYCLAVERLARIEPPERVQYIRVIVAELQRIASHLLAVGTYGLDIGSVTPFFHAFREREKILDLLEELTGARLLYNYVRIGGVAFDLPNGWLDKVQRFLDQFERAWDELNKILTYNSVFIERTARIGVIPAEVAIAYGLTGPNLRGSGVRWDLRKDEPCLVYDRFQFDVPVGTGQYGPLGSAWDRYYVRVQEMAESAKIVRQAIEQMPKGEAGDVQKAIPRVVRPPEGDIYFRYEAARGEIGYYIVSDGSPVPYRVKARSPCFCHISALPEIGPGAMIADAVALVGSLDIVMGEVDR